MANSSLPIRPIRSQVISTCLRNLADLIAQLSHELRDVRIARRRIARQRDLKHHTRVVRGSSGFIVVEARIERGQVELFIDQMIERELEGPRDDLFAKSYRQKSRAAIDLPIACHRSPLNFQIATMQLSVSRDFLHSLNVRVDWLVSQAGASLRQHSFFFAGLGNLSASNDKLCLGHS
jgi:hypothetical protein